MEFFGIGPLEIVLILVVALIAIGPGKLPQYARSLSRGINAFRKTVSDMTAEVTSGLEDEGAEEKQCPRQKGQEIDSTGRVIENEAGDNPDENREGIRR